MNGLDAPPEADRSRRPQILALGDMVLDVVVHAGAARGASGEARGGLRVFPGGGAANTAVAAVRYGAAVRFVGCVGADVSGRLLVDELVRAGVDARVRTIEEEATGYVLVVREDDGSTRMISEPGASTALAPTDLDPRWFAEADAVHLTGYSLLRPKPEAAAREAIRLSRAQSRRVRVSLDPGPAHLIASYGAARLLDLLGALRPTVLLPNLEEGRVLTGTDDPRAIALTLAGVAETVVLKLGGEGCLVVTEGGVTPVPSVPIEVVDTTGAGDAFAGAFLPTWITTGDAIAAARAGAAHAAAVVGCLGARLPG